MAMHGGSQHDEQAVAGFVRRMAFGALVAIAGVLLWTGSFLYHVFQYDALRRAAISGDTAAVAQELRAGRDADGGVAGVTPLMLACLRGHLDTARILIDHGAKVNAENEWGYTPLNRAVGGLHADVVKLLLKRGANPNRRTSRGSPLAIARRYAAKEAPPKSKEAQQIVLLLQAAGARE